MKESGDLTVKENQLPKSTTMKDALVEAARNPNIDPDKLEKLYDLHYRIEKDQREKEFNISLSSFQMECPLIKKTKHVKFGSVDYWYAPLDELISKIKPVMNKYGLSYSFNMFELQGNDYAELVTTIHHINGYKISYRYHFDPVHDDVKMNLSQRRKSAITFAKREGIQSALGIVVTGEDDDAKRAIDEMATQESYDKIERLINVTNSDPEKLKKFLQVEDLKYLSRRDAETLIKALNQKRLVTIEKGKQDV